MGKRIVVILAMFLLAATIACGSAAPAAPKVVEKEVIKEVIKEIPVEVTKEIVIEKLVVATPTPMPPPGTVTGASGSVISATSDMAEMGFDPALDNTSNVKPFYDEMHLYPILQAPDGQLAGGAASKWGVSSDGLSWVFTVREGVKFHNGETMTPEDFSWSWNRSVMSDEAETGASLTYSPRIEYIRAEGDTVVVKTKGPEALMPLWWPSYSGTQAGAVLSKVEFDKTGVEGIRNQPVGAGSFKFVERSRGEFIKLEAFEDHYCCVPGFKDLTVLEVPEISTRMALLKTGGTDLIEAVPAVKRDLAEAGFRIFSGAGATSAVMWFAHQNVEGGPFYDKRVREAFNIAIDRATIVDRLYAGEGGPTTSFKAGPGSFGYNNDLPGYPYDPARAKQLMQEAGYGDGFKVRLVTYKYDADFPDMPILAQAVGGYLEDGLGVDFEVQVMEWTAVKGEMENMLQAVCGEGIVWCHGEEANPELATQAPYTLVLVGNDTRFHALRSNTNYMTPDGSRPFVQLPWVAEGMVQIATEFDLEKQRTMFEELNREMYEEYVQGLLLYSNSLFAVSDKVGDWQPITGRTYPNNHWTLKPAN